jgi:hypothetical protein
MLPQRTPFITLGKQNKRFPNFGYSIIPVGRFTIHKDSVGIEPAFQFGIACKVDLDILGFLSFCMTEFHDPNLITRDEAFILLDGPEATHGIQLYHEVPEVLEFHTILPFSK